MIPTPKCDGVLNEGSSTISSIAINLGGRGSVLLSSSGCRTSSTRAWIPEMLGVTGVSEGVGIFVPTRLGDFEPVKRVHFVRNNFVSSEKDD